MSITGPDVPMSVDSVQETPDFLAYAMLRSWASQQLLEHLWVHFGAFSRHLDSDMLLSAAINEPLVDFRWE